MQIAIVNGARANATPGAIGECQYCGLPMVAKCGAINSWHWAHRRRQGCDPWWENEGPWHLGWKQHFPTDWHEIVKFDEQGEKHIADIRRPDGLTIELQHSAMPIAELESRERFYDRMVWIVDAATFAKNIHIFDPLPDPRHPFVDDLVFFAPLPAWRASRIVRGLNYKTLMFYRRSKQVPESNLVLIERGDSITEDFESTYSGHRLFLWMKPREVWMRATAPVFLDFGDGTIGRLMRYRKEEPLWCLKLGSKAALIRSLNQVPSSPAG